MLTYPRTDAKALPEDYLDTVKQTMENLSENSQDYRAFAKQILQGDPKDPKAKAGYGWIKPNKRIFDNSKISDHFAIIPTLETPKSLS